MTPSIQRILLATDLSPASAAANAQALELARDLGAELLIVNVVDRSKDGMRSPDNLDRLPHEREAEARELAARARSAGIRTTFLIWEGDPGQSIVDAAASEGVDLVIVGRHERGRVGRLLLGSVSQHVVANARCPVLVARP
jgi:nucleotide-binding universal stress UspA family protein